jgi:hypothetical protein
VGKASRRKHERRFAPSARATKPRWAGAAGFDRAWMIADRYASAWERFQATPRADPRQDTKAFYHHKQAEAHLAIHTLSFQAELAERKLGTLHQLLGEDAADDDRRDPAGPAELSAKDRSEMLLYARALGTLATDHLRHLREATPVVFDPLAVPDATPDAAVGLALPFPTVVADFLSPTGMSMPVQVFNAREGWWVGLIAATIAQGEEGGPIDVWPTVTTLQAARDDDKQTPRELVFGHVRIGGPLPPAPDGLTHVQLDGADAWVVDIDDPKPWALLWLLQPALAAISALRLLDAVNVSLIDMPLARPARRRAEREGATPALKVDITTGRATGAGVSDAPGSIDWQHRWTVRGHWKHFGETTAIARRHPSRIVDVPGRGRCVKVWCPPFVKGPADKPLILKSRHVAVTPEP